MARVWIPIALLATAALAGCVEFGEPGSDDDPFPPDEGPFQPDADESTPVEPVPTHEGTAPPAHENGSASLYTNGTAASAVFAEIHVAFTLVEVHAAEGGHGAESSPDDEGQDNGTDGNQTTLPDGNKTDGDQTTSEEGEAEPGWHTIVQSDVAITVDLLNATNGTAAFLGEADLPWGHYQQLAVTVVAAWGIDQDGVRHDFGVPSDKIRFITPFQVLEGLETRIILEIDLDSSVQEQGDGWMFHPVPGTISAEAVPDESCGEDIHEVGQVAPVEECD